MTLKLTLFLTTLFYSLNINAGWFDDLISSGETVKEKIESTKESVKNDGTIDSIKSSLSNEDIVTGLKQALNKGTNYAVKKLGKPGGFLNNTDVKIPMPEKLEKVESLLRKVGKDKYADEFVTTLNHAAESAVPLTLSILKQSVADMSIEDAENILHGPDDAATQYMKKSGQADIINKIAPIVENITAEAGVTSMYKEMYDKLGFAGKYLNLEDYNVDSYVTQKTTDGLFTMIAVQEKKIRDNPAKRTTEILKSVFGAD